jgi:glutamyl-tRNA synthetase
MFNWLFARHTGGKFIVRVEDTDQERLVPGAVDNILDGLEWLGIDWDEGPRVGGEYAPYFQSERLQSYRDAAEDLVRKGAAYHCYCSRERLAQVREEQQRQKQSIRYDGHCRHLTDRQRRELEAQGGPSVVRFAMPATGITTVQDLIRGGVEWDNSLLDDFILIKSDGFPTYHMANVVDDHLMEISHVMRAEEWLPSTPRHLQLFRALGFDPPEFAHLPMIVGPDRAKLSKRHGAASIWEYEEQGYLPDALLNFMVLLGWSLDDKTDVTPLQTVIDNFTLGHVTKSAAIFDQDKLLWMNGVYIRELSAEDLAGWLALYLERHLPPDCLPLDRDYLLRIAPLVRERLKRFDEAAEMTAYFFSGQQEYAPAILVQKGMDRDTTLGALAATLDELRSTGDFGHERLEEMLGETGQRLELTRRQFFGLLRVAATGRTVSPPLFETMEVLGKDLILSRFETAVERLRLSTVK